VPPTSAVHSVRTHRYRVARIVDATHDVRRIWMEPADGARFTFEAGQFASVRFGSLAPRDYSMASRPDEAILEFHIRRVGRDGASVYVAQALKLGDEVLIEGPFGDAWLRRNHKGPVVAIAGGSGLAPIKSIVETALALGMTQDVRLYFGVRDEPDLYLENHFTALAERHPNFRFIPVLSDAKGETRRRTGLVGSVVADELGDVRGYKAYLAGPPPMVESASAMLKAKGLGADDVHADPFYTEAEMVARGRAPRT
jgi:CDP-4-dehydro-6-deoxyglucose reductase/ferredoxin-NAD(P)+ reductase (naphthalene dioxygenase ferredoxin-specific)